MKTENLLEIIGIVVLLAALCLVCMGILIYFS